MMQLPQVAQLSTELALPERELLLEVCSDLDQSVELFLIDNDTSHYAFFDDLRSTSALNLLVDHSVDVETLDYLKQTQLKPRLVPATKLPQFRQFHSIEEAWILPFNVAYTGSKWLLLFDGQRLLDEKIIENVFLKLSWALTQRKLEITESQLEKANAWIDQELEEMTRLQQLMLPDRKQSIPGVKIAFKYRAMRGAGGDYIDFLSKRENSLNPELHKLGVIVADVTGHGPSAAMEVAMLDAILRTYRPSEDLESPSFALNYINKHFFTRKERSSFITAVACHYCPMKRKLLYANAGHPNAYIKRGDKIISLDGGGIPIGVVRDYTWELYEIKIEPNDTLFVYTDVVIETKDPENRYFGFERLEQALQQGNSEPELLLKSIEAQLKAFCRCKEFQDDMTMCAVQFI